MFLTYFRKFNLPLEELNIQEIEQIKEKIEKNKNQISFAVNGDNKQLNVTYSGNIPYQHNFN